MIDKTNRTWMLKRFNLLVFERFGIKADDMNLDLLKVGQEIADRWTSSKRFDVEDTWHVSVMETIINARLDTIEPLYNKNIYGGKK